jgi:hypothetical protein
MKRHISLQLRGVGQFVANYQECTIAPGTTGRNGNSSADEIRKAVLQSCKLAIAFFAADCPLIYEKPRSDTRTAVTPGCYDERELIGSGAKPLPP